MGDMADAARDQEDWSESEDNEGESTDDRETLRGLVTDWQTEKGKGPARLKIAGQKAQVWPYEFGDDERTEKSEVYRALKTAAIEDGAVEAIGEYKDQEPFYSEKAKRDITPAPVFQVYEADPIEVTDELKKVNAKAAVPRGKAAPRGNGGGKATLSKEEWAEKDRQQSAAIRSAWAVQTAAQLLVAKTGEPPTLEQVENVAESLVTIADRVRTTILSSGSGSATASPSPTSAPEPPSAPAGKESAPSKASKKPAKTSKSG